MAIWVMVDSSGKSGAVPVGRNPDPANEVAAHGFRGAESAARGDRRDGVVGLFELPTGGFGADAFDVRPRCLADLFGEDPGEMPWAHRRPAGQVRNAVHSTGFGFDGLLHLTDRGPLRAGHPDRGGELGLPAGSAQIQHQPAGDGLGELVTVVVL